MSDDVSSAGSRPVPGPPATPRPGAWLGRAPVGPAAAGAELSPPTGGAAPSADPEGRFAGLAGRPVPEHVGVFEAELERLQRELSTIDQL